jgi:hypothetical protein
MAAVDSIATANTGQPSPSAARRQNRDYILARLNRLPTATAAASSARRIAIAMAIKATVPV